MVDRLAGKIVVVTGAANGIGRGCAAMVRAEGGQVIGVDISGADRACDARGDAAGLAGQRHHCAKIIE